MVSDSCWKQANDGKYGTSPGRNEGGRERRRKRKKIKGIWEKRRKRRRGKAVRGGEKLPYASSLSQCL